MSLAIEAASLGKTFGPTVALAELNLAVETGEVFGLIGPNGAGKTTTMRLLLDVIRPTSGRLAVLGLDPRAGGPQLRGRLAFLPGELRLTSRATGRELLDFYARLQGGVATANYEGLAERLGLDLAARVGTLSKGNKQKLGLVQAFMRPAELLILDEPTSGLDPVMQRVFLDLVREAQAEGRTVLLSSHVLSEIQQVAGRVAILRRGRLVKLESVAALRAGAPRRVRLNARREELPAVRQALEQTPPELSADVAERGIVLTGGGAMLRDIDKLLMEETGLPVIIADDPLTCVARGGGRVIELIDEHGPAVFGLE